jgi:hypothetical protein
MNALVVVESMYGNTAKIAEAIGTQIGAEVVGPAELTDERLEGIDLLVVGAPTHAFGLPRASTRRDAMQKTGRPVEGTDDGLRERLEALHDHRGLRTAAFSTRIEVRGLPSRSADKVIAKMLRKRGFEVVAKEAFLVDGSEGPIHEGEIERAKAWVAEAA